MSTAANKQKLLEHLRKSPVIQVACQRAGVARATYYRWLKADESFADAAHEAVEHGVWMINDMAESQLISAIKDKNMTGIIYWLKTHHPAYETRIKLDAHIKHGVDDLTPEQAEMVARALQLGGLLPEGNHESE